MKKIIIYLLTCLLFISSAYAVDYDSSNDYTFNCNLAVEGSTGISIGEDKAAGTVNDEGILKLWSDGDNAYSTIIKTGTQTQDVTYILPLDDGTANQLLKTDGTGVLSWDSESDPVVGSVNGIIKADGAGNISAATSGTDYTNIGNTIESAEITDGTIVNADIADDTIAEVKLDIYNAPSDGYYLKYTTANGMEWATGGGGASQLSDLSDVGTVSYTAGQYLRADGTDYDSASIQDGDLPSTITRDTEWDTSTKIANNITDETGSGALVFGTSPTFTTDITTPKITNSDNITIDAVNATANSTVSITNSDATYKANLTVDGNVSVAGSARIKGATNSGEANSFKVGSGDATDLEIYNDSSNNYIYSPDHNLMLKANTGHILIRYNGALDIVPYSTAIYLRKTTRVEGDLYSRYNTNNLGTSSNYWNNLYLTGNIISDGNLILDPTGNVGIGTTSFGTDAVKVLAIANGTAPTSSPADAVQLYAEDVSASSELKVRDEAGNITTLSANVEGYPDDMAVSKDYPYVTLRENVYKGVSTYVSLNKMAELVQELAKEKGLLPQDKYIIKHIAMDSSRIEDKEAQIREEKIQKIMEEEVEVSKEEALEEVEETEQVEVGKELKVRYELDFETGEIKTIKKEVPVYEDKLTRKMKKQLKAGVRFDSETGKFYRKKTREEAIQELNEKTNLTR